MTRTPLARTLAAVALALVALVAAACNSDDPTATPTPGAGTLTATPAPDATAAPTPQLGETPARTPTPTPTPPLTSPINDPPPGFKLIWDETQGFALHYPDAWGPGSVTQTFGAALSLESANGTTHLAVYTGIEGWDMPADQRMDAAVASFTSVIPGDVIIDARDPITLDSGLEATVKALLFTQGEVDREQRLYLITSGLRTYVVTATGAISDLDAHRDAIADIVASFVTFEPARFGVAREQSLTMPWSDPLTLDPAMSREATSHLIVAHLFAGLTRFDANLAVQLDLATSVDFDATGTIYRFTLRENAAFHDGRPITAEDVRYSIERAADPDLHSQTAALYLGDIVGVAAKLAGNADSISGINVIDERTIALTIDAPKAYFLAKLTYPTAAVVDRITIDPRGPEWWKGTINGSGPFKLKEWTEGELLVIERFDGYHTPSTLQYAVFPINEGTPMQLYEAEVSDVAFIGGATIDRALDPANGLSDQLRVFPQFLTNYVGLNTQKPPFDDPKVRRAFLLALDRAELIEVVYGGDVDLAKGLLPPGLPGYNEALEPVPFDPDTALALLRDSTYAASLANGTFPDVGFTTSGFGGVPADIQFMIAQWSQHLGIDVQVRSLSPDTYYYSLAQEVDNLFDYGWIADYPDPQNFLDVLLHSTSTENNVGGYTSAAYDRLLEQARSETNHTQRMALYQQAEQILMDDAGIIPLFHAPDYVLTKPHVQGFAIGPLGIPLLQNVTVAPRQ
jgi:oligopeptide transport system substrate-binding protein